MKRPHPTLLYTLIILALALLLTWPLPLHLATHAPGDGSDDPAILWNLWWVRYAITELGQSPFQSAWMFWPIGVNLIFYTLTTLNGLLSIPVQLAWGLVPANSFIVYFELVVAALGMWLFVRWILAFHPDGAPFPRATRDGIALLAAIVYAFSASKWLYLSVGQFNIASSHWLPWSLLYLGRMWNAPTLRRGLRDTALCALFVLFTGWTEFTYASFFAQFVALFWFWMMLVGLKQGLRDRMGRFTLLCAALALFVLLGMSPILVPMLQDLQQSGDFLVEGLGFSNTFSNDLLGFFIPGDQHPLFGAWVRERFDFAYLNFAFVGWVTLALVLLALVRRATRPYALYWSLFAAAFALLSLGPTLRINGREWELPLPFDLLLQIPILKANRYPSRYSVLIALCLAVAVAWGASALLTLLRERRATVQRAVLAGLAALLLLEHFGAPLPLSDYRVPPVYHALREQPGEAVLELPLAWRNGFRVTGTLHPAFMFAQAFQSSHHKRLLSGNTSRNPEFKFQYFTELPVINSLLALETGMPLPPDRAARDAALAPELLRLLDAPSIVVRLLDSDDPAISPDATLPYLETILDTTRWHESDDYVGLAARLPTPPDRYDWDATHPLARLFFAEGWSALPPLDPAVHSPLIHNSQFTIHNSQLPSASPSLYAESSTARLLLPSIATPGAWRLRFEATVPDGRETPVEIFVADPAGGAAQPLATLTLRGTNTYEVVIPPTAPRGPLTELRFRFGTRHTVTEIAAEQDAQADRPAGYPFSLLVESAGLPVGDFAHLYVNGVDVATSATGYHVALLAPDGVMVRHFDTFNDPQASAALAAFIGSATPGTLVAVAAADTVSQGEGTGGLMVGDDVIAAFESIGATATSDLRGRYGWSHALIGIKGSAPGSALEDSSAIRPARVAFGPALHAPAFAAQFGQFSLTADEEMR